jgi:chromosome partitioning protein
MGLLGAIIIGFFVLKGGNSKSTTLLEFCYALRRIWQKKVLVIDLDPQMTTTNFLTIQEDETYGSIYDVLTGSKKITEVIQKSKHCDFISGSPMLADIDAYLSKIGKDRILKENLELIKPNYSTILVDFPPAASKVTISGLNTLNKLIITCQADPFSSIDSLIATNELYLAVKQYYSPTISLAGILISRFKKTMLSEEIIKAIEEIAAKMGTFVYKSRIRDSVLIREAQLAKTSVLKYAGNSPVASDILEFMDEFGDRYGKEI